MAIDSKRIAKNTGLLYFRMLLMIVISLYTSRILLDTLGVEDFGIYNVVGGVVVMIGFLNGTMGTTSSRFITVSLGQNDMKEMRKTFSSILLVNLFLALLVFVLAETIGLWFLIEKMTIPPDRADASMWVYQLSVISVMFTIVTVPFNAVIIAHEKMGAFAYISLFDAFAKLGIVYLLLFSPLDRLVFYAILMLFVHVVNMLIYIVYCLWKFPEASMKVIYDRTIIKSVFGFISWASYGSFVSVGFTQGLNIILNLFFDPAVNAARGIAVQVQNATVHFTTNFQTALNPQLMKSTSQNNFTDARQLLVASSKYSFFLLCIIGLPIIIETPFILNLWLKEVPEYSVAFCRIILVTSIWGSLANPLRIVNHAEGNIKKFQLYECTALLLIMPVSYFMLKIWEIPILVFVVHFVIELIAQFIRIAIVIPKIELDFRTYMKNVYCRIMPVFFIPLTITWLISRSQPESLWSFCCVTFLLELLLFSMIYLIGFTTSEKGYAINAVKKCRSRYIHI